jgi:hypothetical protein
LLVPQIGVVDYAIWDQGSLIFCFDFIGVFGMEGWGLPCILHLHTYTLIPEITNRANKSFTHNHIIENNASKNTQNLPKPRKEMLNVVT